MKKCRLPKNPSEKASISVDGKFLTEVLKRVDAVTRFSESADALTHSHLLVTYKGDVFIVGRTPDTFVCYEVLGATSSEKDTVFNIDPKHLLGLVNKRRELNIEYNHPMVVIKEAVGKYRSDFKVKQLSPEQVPMVEEGLRHHIAGGHEMGREVMEQMTAGVRATRIKDVISDEATVCRVTCTGSEMRVISGDNWTSSRFIAPLKDEAEAFRFSLSSEMFDLIAKFCGESAITFHVDSSAFTAEAENFVVTLPPIQATDEDYRYVDNMIEAMGKPLVRASLLGDLSAPFSNIATIVEKKGNTNATLQFKKSECVIKFGNDLGSVQDALSLSAPVKKSFNTPIDMRIMKELLKVIGREEVHDMGFHGASLEEFKAFTLSYQDDNRSLLYFGYIPS